MFRMTVADVFFITGRGLVATGKIEDGTLRVGDEVRVNNGPQVRVDGIEAFRKVLDQAQTGDNVGLLLKGLDRSDVKAGDVITGEAAPGDIVGAQAPAPPPPAFTPPTGKDPRFARAEAQRAQFLSMRESGLMSEAQIDEALNGLMFSAAGRHWLLRADGDAWYSSDGGNWKHDSPPG